MAVRYVDVEIERDICPMCEHTIIPTTEPPTDIFYCACSQYRYYPPYSDLTKTGLSDFRKKVPYTPPVRYSYRSPH